MRRMQAPGAKILAGLKDAIAGDFARVTIDGQTWVRADVHDHFMAQRNALLAVAKRWRALDAGAWHPERHAAEKAELLEDTGAAIALAETERT